MSRFNRSQSKGATGIAYGLLVGLVAVVALGAIQGSGSSVTSLFNTTSDSLGSAVTEPEAAAAPSASAVPSPALAPSSVTINQTIGVNTCTTVTLTNSGPGGPSNINIAVSGDYTQSGCSASNCQGSSMGGPASCEINLRGNASSAGPISGDIDVTADNGLTHNIAVTGTAFDGGFTATDSSSGFTFHMVQVPQSATINTLADYHSLCQTYGLTAWDTSGTNTACQGDLENYPIRVGSCNMGNFNSTGYNYTFNVDVPSISRVWWLAVNHSNNIGLEYNGVGPCLANEQIGACGTGSLSGSGNGIRHSKNPIYSSNYNVQNASLTTSHYMLCAAP
ncbi:MAG: hypothetical protein Alpg2KO_03090 [Alphaproteobacteria bacterium]